MLIDFREKRRERERNKRETSIHALIKDQICKLDMCPDWELNPQPFGVQDDTPTIGNKQPGLRAYFYYIIKILDISCPELEQHINNVIKAPDSFCLAISIKKSVRLEHGLHVTT